MGHPRAGNRWFWGIVSAAELLARSGVCPRSFFYGSQNFWPQGKAGSGGGGIFAGSGGARIFSFEMKLSLVDCLNEIAQKRTVDRSVLPHLKNLARFPNTYIHFTNEPKKVGFNPRPGNGNYIYKNPKGFYGLPLKQFLDQALETRYMMHDREKYLIVFCPDPTKKLNLFKADDWDETVKTLNDKGSSNTIKLINQGYDGVISSKGGLSGDIDSEIVIFKPSNVRVLLIAPNSLPFELHSEFYKQRLKNAKMDDQDPESIENSIKSMNKKGRYHRWRNPI